MEPEATTQPSRRLAVAVVVTLVVALVAGGLYLFYLSREDDRTGLSVEALPSPGSDALPLDPGAVQREAPALWDALMDANGTGHGHVPAAGVDDVVDFLERESARSGRDWHQVSVEGKGYALGIETL